MIQKIMTTRIMMRKMMKNYDDEENGRNSYRNMRGGYDENDGTAEMVTGVPAVIIVMMKTMMNETMIEGGRRSYNQSSRRSRRGFGAMSPERVRQLARREEWPPAEAEVMMIQIVARALIEDHRVVMVAEAMMNQETVVIRMEECQMDEVEDQQHEEHQMADLLKAGVEVLQEIQMEDHPPPELQMEVVTGVKALQQEEAKDLHQLMEEELVVKRVALLQAANEIHVDVVNER
jgi:hypothetical protein